MLTGDNAAFIVIYPISNDISSGFARNSEALASKILENLDDIMS